MRAADLSVKALGTGSSARFFRAITCRMAFCQLHCEGLFVGCIIKEYLSGPQTRLILPRLARFQIEGVR